MPGSMLLAEEYSFGVWKSLEQHTHSVDGGVQGNFPNMLNMWQMSK